MIPQGGGNLSQTNTGDRLVTVLNFPVDNERTATTRVMMDETVLPKKNTFSLYALRGNTRDSLPLPPF